MRHLMSQPSSGRHSNHQNDRLPAQDLKLTATEMLRTVLYRACSRMPNETPTQYVVINKHCRWIMEARVLASPLKRECSENLIRGRFRWQDEAPMSLSARRCSGAGVAAFVGLSPRRPRPHPFAPSARKINHRFAQSLEHDEQCRHK